MRLENGARIRTKRPRGHARSASECVYTRIRAPTSRRPQLLQCGDVGILIENVARDTGPRWLAFCASLRHAYFINALMSRTADYRALLIARLGFLESCYPRRRIHRDASSTKAPFFENASPFPSTSDASTEIETQCLRESDKICQYYIAHSYLGHPRALSSNALFNKQALRVSLPSHRSPRVG